MNKISFVILVIIALAISAISIYFVSTNSPQTGIEAKGKFLPNFKTEIPTIEKIIISKANHPNITIAKSSSGWVVSEKQNLPANKKAVNDLVLSISEAELLEAKTSKKENYHYLGVEDITAPDSKSTRIIFEASSNKTIQDIIIGNYKIRKGTYVRKTNEEQSWLTEQKIIIHNSFLDWIDRDIIKIDQDQFVSVYFVPANIETQEGTEAKPYILSRTDSASDIELTLPEKTSENSSEMKLKSQHVAQNLFRLIGEFKLDDVEILNPSEFESKKVSKRIYTTVDGIEIEISCLAMDNGKAKVMLKAKSLNENKENNPKISELNRIYSGRAFIIANHLVGKFNKNLSDIAEIVEAETPAKEKPSEQ